MYIFRFVMQEQPPVCVDREQRITLRCSCRLPIFFLLACAVVPALLRRRYRPSRGIAASGISVY